MTFPLLGLIPLVYHLPSFCKTLNLTPPSALRASLALERKDDSSDGVAAIIFTLKQKSRRRRPAKQTEKP
jgi:hypothetical protein